MAQQSRKYSQKFYPNNELENVGIVEYFQLLNHDGNYLSFNSLCQSCNISTKPDTYLCYLKLIKVIPSKWESIRYENVVSETSFSQLNVALDNEYFLFKNMYNFYVKFYRKPPIKSQTKYAEMIDVDNNYFDWSKRYSLLHYCTIENKLRAIQIKINIRAFDIGILSAHLCLLRRCRGIGSALVCFLSSAADLLGRSE